MTTPLRPAHADKTMAVPGASARFSMTRHLEGYAYPENGNVHNPTPIYRWLLKLDGQLVDHSTQQRTIVDSARIIGVKGYEEVRAAGTAVETVDQETPVPPLSPVTVSAALWHVLLSAAGFSEDERLPLTPQEAEVELAEELAYFHQCRKADPAYGTRQATEVPR